jgi:hypothetical protein
MLPHCRKTGGHGFCRAEKIFGRVGAKSEGTPPGVPKSFFSVVLLHDRDFSAVREHCPPVFDLYAITAVQAPMGRNPQCPNEFLQSCHHSWDNLGY